ncbi:MAG: PAS domain S-box protein, partial [Syntrophobacteraceae bacterium]
AEGKSAMQASLAGREPVLSDLFLDPARGHILMEAVAPIYDDQGRLLGLMVLLANVDNSLYPLVQSWPTPSPTAETLLVKIDRGEVVVLNDLRHRENTALSMRHPLTDTNLAAVQAVLGRQGMFEGADYRGVRILANLRAVPESSWFMVAKVDLEEIFAEARFRTLIIFLISGLFILFTGAATAYGYRQRQILLLKELYRTERDQRQNQEEYRITLYGIGDGVISTDSNGLVKQMNQVAEKLTGWLEANARGKPLDEIFVIINEQTRLPVANPVQRVLNEGVVVGLANHTLLISKDGTERPIADSGSPIRNDNNELVGVVLIFRDQTQERAAQKLLEESEERFRNLVESAPDAIFIQAGGFFTYLNPSAAKLFGADSPVELVGTPVMDRYHHSFHEKIRERLHQLAVFKQQVPLQEQKWIRLDKTPVDVEATEVPTLHSGLFGILVFARDISERKKVELEKKKLEAQLRQAQKIEAIGTLAGGIAHDFNNILAPIIGYTEMVLSEMPEPSPLRSDLEQVLQASYRAKELVRQILVSSRFTQEQQMAPLDVSMVVKEALKLLRSSLPTTIEIKQEIETVAALADPTQIHQVVMNLCTNSAHAMNDSGILEVKLEKVRLDSDCDDLSANSLPTGLYLKLTISDTGCGMDAKTMERIFDPYFTTKGVGKGSGLGLAVVLGIVKRHGGMISVRSEPGEGSAFIIFLPSVDGKPEPIKDSALSPPAGTESILLVDDEPQVVEIGARLLERLGYRVTASTDASDALMVFRSRPDDFDLVITDYTMPKMNGIDLAREILEIRSGTPILLCTGYSEHVTPASVETLGLRLILKPYGIKELSEMVRKLIERARTA